MSGSGAVNKAADATAKAGKAIDWDGMAKMLVSEEARKEFANLRRAFGDVNHQLQTMFSQVKVLAISPMEDSGIPPLLHHSVSYWGYQ